MSVGWRRGERGIGLGKRSGITLALSLARTLATFLLALSEESLDALQHTLRLLLRLLHPYHFHLQMRYLVMMRRG